MRVAILDYGAGNLHSLVKAVRLAADMEVTITPDASVAIAADALVLPGVGAFGSASAAIAPDREILRTALAGGLPCLGICLGMQLLFDESTEGQGNGLGVIPGGVRRLEARRVPQMGWNKLENADDPLFDSSRLETAYFANSYVCEPIDDSCITSWATHESDRFAASVRVGSIVGVQFHPEKSSSQGCEFIGEFFRRARR
jgi:imidazole glycerol-phosphate synthase subunit HisH